uniref:Sperm associated antigen 17 n=1 Tax=Sphaeramia orbicularis TaxID=375764 RepID=A0A672YSF0_9TELE
MPPKAAKKSSARKSDTGASAVNKNWEAGLIKAPFEEDSWKACVSLVVGRNPEDENLIQALALAVQKPVRKLFTVLTWGGTLAKVNLPAKMLLDAGEQIPCDLMAKIVKFLLLQIKTNDQQRREAEKVSHMFKNGSCNAIMCSSLGEDDEPDDGPQHYVLLLGFYQPHLVGALDSMGVHVANVIQLLSQETETIEGQQENHNSNKENDRPSSVLFWSGLRPLLDSGPPDSKLHDVAQLSYTVTDHRPPFDKQDPEAALALGCRIFEGVAHLVYDCLDWRRQHQHYLDNIKLINVPKVIVVLTPPPMSPRSKKRTPRGEKAQLPPLSTDVDMRYYNNLLDLVSPESCSVPLILHSMLEQVCMCMLKISPSRGKIQNVVSWPEVERLFHHSVFESMPLTTLHQKGVLLNATGSLQTPPIIPWDNPLSYAKQQFSILSRKGHLYNNFLHICSQTGDPWPILAPERLDLSWRWLLYHIMTTVDSKQVLQLASEEYRCMDTFRGSSNNILYIFCHNPMTGHRQCKESWDVALHTNIKFRKYLEHVANTITDWTKEEEAKTEAMQQEKLSPAEPPEGTELKTCDHLAKNQKIFNLFSMYMTLQAWKLEQERLKEEEVSKKSKKDSTQKGRQAKEEASLKDNNKGQNNPPLSGKKSRTATACSLDKTSPETKITTVPPVEESKESQLTEEPLNGFSGYNMDGKLVHVSGQVQYLYPSDGGTIAVETVSYVEGSSLMKVAVKKDGHHFYTHINHVVVESSKASSEPQDKQTSEKSEDVKGNGHDSEAVKRPLTFMATRVPFIMLSMFPGVPSKELGLLVRQSFPLHGRGDAGQLEDPSLSKELSRTVTSQGTVIRYMRDGSTEVLFADGSVSNSQDSGPVWVPDSEVQKREEAQSSETSAKTKTGCWTTTTPTGARICTVGITHEYIPTVPLLAFKATDPITNEVMVTREDLVMTVQNPNGSFSVEHADGTRITNLYQDRPPNTPPHILMHTGGYHTIHRHIVTRVTIEIKPAFTNGSIHIHILCRRLFLVQEDGSGVELLSSQTVEELLFHAYSDPTIAVLKEPLPDTEDEFSITILRPSHQSMWSQWLLGKQNPDITPPNLKNRSWHDFPRVEKQSPGPPFGTDMGRGLTLNERSGGSAAHRLPVKNCPKVLEMSELYQHRPFTTLLKNTVDKRLKVKGIYLCDEVLIHLMEREQRSEEMRIKDPRTVEETVHASDLLNLVLVSTHREIHNIVTVITNCTNNNNNTCMCLLQFLSVEEPVRRKCRTVSLTDGSAIVRGFQLLPTVVDFGTLQEGTSSTITVVMKNVGVDTCRFHVKQPPCSTGLRVIYNPGPVAAGLQVELQVQLFAMCAVRAGGAESKTSFSQDITIQTETEILYLPVTANILSIILSKKKNPLIFLKRPAVHICHI